MTHVIRHQQNPKKNFEAHISVGNCPVAILTGKSTKNGNGVNAIIFKYISGKNRSGMICPDKIIFAILYAITSARTS